MNKAVKYIFLFLLILAEVILPQSNTSEIKIKAVRTSEKIIIDGILSEEIWKRDGFTGLEQQDPDQGKKPSQDSEVWIYWFGAAGS